MNLAQILVIGLLVVQDSRPVFTPEQESQIARLVQLNSANKPGEIERLKKESADLKRKALKQKQKEAAESRKKAGAIDQRWKALEKPEGFFVPAASLSPGSLGTSPYAEWRMIRSVNKSECVAVFCRTYYVGGDGPISGQYSGVPTPRTAESKPMTVRHAEGAIQRIPNRDTVIEVTQHDETGETVINLVPPGIVAEAKARAREAAKRR